MVYYTIKGEADNLQEFFGRSEIRGMDIDENQIAPFANFVILVTQWDIISNHVYASGDGTNTIDHGAQLLIPGTYYSITLSVTIIEILKALFKLTLVSEFKDKFITIVELGFKIYASGIKKLNNRTYCVYKKMLQLVRDQKSLSLSFSLVKDKTLVDQCDTDLPKVEKCYYDNSSDGKCGMTDKKLMDVLSQLERRKLIMLDMPTIRIIL